MSENSSTHGRFNSTDNMNPQQLRNTNSMPSLITIFSLKNGMLILQEEAPWD